MILDLNEMPDGATVTADICIVGGGIAGIALATELLKSGGSSLRVILLESGGAKIERESQKLNEADIVGLKHGTIQDGRIRALGGLSNLWAGVSIELDSIDFQRRDWVPHSGWPFRKEDLRPYYDRAARFMKLEGRINIDANSFPRRYHPPEYDESRLKHILAVFGPKPDLRVEYSPWFRSDDRIQVILHANATMIATNRDGTAVEEIEIRSLKGRAAKARASIFIVACGGVETPRLLLASDRFDHRGIGNAHDLVGRFFNEHLHAKLALIKPINRNRIREIYHRYYYNGIKYFPKILCSEDVQIEHKILNIFGDVTYEPPPDSTVTAAKFLLRAVRHPSLLPKAPRSVFNILRRPHELVDAIFRYTFIEDTASEKRGDMFLGIQSECEPNPESRVRLSSSLDPLGSPRAELDWRLTDLDRRTLIVFAETVAAEFRRLGLGEIDLASMNLPENPRELDRAVYDAGHHMGTTRMHDDPRRGVVDADCKVHGVSNLYIAGSSVFPTGGAANPTFTIIALCMKLADRIAAELADLPSLDDPSNSVSEAPFASS